MQHLRSPASLLLLLPLSWSCVGREVTCHDLVTCPQPGSGGSSGAAGESSGGSGGVSATEGTTASSGETVSTDGGTKGTTASGSGMTSTGGTAATSSGGSTAATSGGSGGAGGTGSAPCDGACGGATPVCKEDTDSCVGCVENPHCSDDTPACDTDTNTCVECTETSDCDDGVCDTETHLCVQCLTETDCQAPTPLCDTEQQFCVECLGNTHCADTQSSFCDAGACSPCQANDDCAHLSGTTVCDAAVGECVQCTIAEEAVCGGTSCNPATRTCTQTELGTVDDCEPCLADSECIGNDQAEPLRRCVPMEFGGEPRDQAYCLVRRSQVSQCARPYSVVITGSSLSGTPEESYCGIGQEVVTCEAVLDLFQSRTCPGGQDTECGCPRDIDGNCTAPGQGGLCRNLPAADNQCTYECGTLNDCPTSRSCSNQDPDFCQ